MSQTTAPSPDPPAESPATAPAAEVQPSLALWKPCLAIVIFFLALDHWTKYLAIVHLKPEWWGVVQPTQEMWDARPAVVLIPQLLQLQYAENLGAAFSILYGYTFFLGIISAVATVLLLWFWRSLPATEATGRVSVALILSGAIGNMIDRFGRGYVVDFIDAHWFHQVHWPTFNIADSAIVVGAVLLSIQFLRGRI